MIINATELKNNLGKYLRASAREEIVITSNGRKVARLVAIEDADKQAFYESYLKEKAEAYARMPKKVTYEEFLEIAENSDDRFEYIDGELYMMASPNFDHQQALGELYVIFYNWFMGKACRPMLAPFDITLKRTEENKNVVQPDLMVICDLEQKLKEKKKYEGIPALLVEILSESTRGRDSVKKLDLYMSTGVREYWIVNPFIKEVTVYLFENNDLAKSVVYRKNENVSSFVFGGLEVSLKSIFGSRI
jgi:prevent-host-death family protein